MCFASVAKESNGEMIACDSPICSVEWFHLDCLGLSLCSRE